MNAHCGRLISFTTYILSVKQKKAESEVITPVRDEMFNITNGVSRFDPTTHQQELICLLIHGPVF